jgi:hypothetical protein
MLKKLALATAALALITSTASADYYIVQEKATKEVQGRRNSSDRNHLDPDRASGLQDAV